eukprot:6090955-Prymnesium_polylepis.2
MQGAVPKSGVVVERHQIGPERTEEQADKADQEDERQKEACRECAARVERPRDVLRRKRFQAPKHVDKNLDAPVEEDGVDPTVGERPNDDRACDLVVADRIGAAPSSVRVHGPAR